MNRFSYLPFFMILVACQFRNNSNSVADSTAVDSAISVSADTTISEQTDGPPLEAPEVPSDGVFILAGTTIYSDTTLTTSIAPEAATITRGTKISTSIRFYPEEADYCGRHPICQLKFGDLVGWVAGANVLLEMQTANNYLSSVEFNGQSYAVYTAADTGIGPADSDGLTGCNRYEVLYFVNQENGNVQFVNTTEGATKEGVAESYQGLFSLVSSDGASSTISSAEADNDEIRIMFSVSYQEGGDTAILHIGKSEGEFFAKSFEIETRD